MRVERITGVAVAAVLACGVTAGCGGDDEPKPKGTDLGRVGRSGVAGLAGLA